MLLELINYSSSYNSFMGFPDSPKLLSDKDLHAMECNFLSRPSTLGCQQLSQINAPSNDERVDELNHQEQKLEAAQVGHDDRDDQKQDTSGGLQAFFSSLKVKLPEVREVLMVDIEEEDGFTTPTSPDYKIPQVCPPAPRKPKSVPSINNNRKGCRRRVLLDLSNEIESLFPAAILADFGNKIKKVRREKNVLI